MDLVMVVLRLIHILAGVFWAGSAFTLVQFVLPAAIAAGPAGGQFMQGLLRLNFTRIVLAAGTLNVLAGLILYLRDSGGLQLAWITTGTGLTLTIGALAALAALLYAGAVTAPAAAQLQRLGQEVQAGGKPPTPEQGAKLGALQARMARAARLNALLLGIAVIAMAIARYV